MTREVEHRLGCGPGGEDAVKKHLFFASIDWVKLEARQVSFVQFIFYSSPNPQPPPPARAFCGQVETPFRPKVRSARDVAQFDPDFTGEDVVLTPCDKTSVAAIDQAEFEGFSFVNPRFLADSSHA